jgi:Fic family protein
MLEAIKDKREKLAKLFKNKQNQTVLDKWLKTELAYTSNAIEGNTLTRKETALVIEEGITGGIKPLKDYIEAQNHAKAFDFILDEYSNHKLISENTVLEIHKIILSGINDADAGLYRSVRVYISGSRTVLPNPVKVLDLMTEFGKWLTDTENSAGKAIEAHYKLVTIHPFVDGNGRTARLLMNLILLQAGYCPIIVRPRDRKRYLNILENRQTKEEVEPYSKFMLEALSRSLDAVIDLLDIEKEDVAEEKLMTIGKFAQFVGLPISTIRYWVEIGKLKPIAKTASDYLLFSKDQKKEIESL